VASVAERKLVSRWPMHPSEERIDPWQWMSGRHDGKMMAAASKEHRPRLGRETGR
jgi:hypothetical protein